MSADIIDLAAKRPAPNPGNGAREALIETVMTNNDVMTQGNAGNWADWVLTELWLRGFKVVPLSITDEVI